MTLTGGYGDEGDVPHIERLNRDHVHSTGLALPMRPRKVVLPPEVSMLVETSSVMKQGFSPMQWLLAQAEDAPRLTPEQWAEWQRSLYEQQLQQLNDSLWGPLWIYWVIEALGVLFTLWMIIYCIRNDSERGTWLAKLLLSRELGNAANRVSGSAGASPSQGHDHQRDLNPTAPPPAVLADSWAGRSRGKGGRQRSRTLPEPLESPHIPAVAERRSR